MIKKFLHRNLRSENKSGEKTNRSSVGNIFKKFFRRGIRTKKINRSIGGNIMLFIFLALAGTFMFLPMAYTIINAFKPLDELFIYPPRFFVISPTTDNFVSMFQLISNMWVPFSRYIFNTVFITIVGTIVCVYISSMAAYPLAKLNFKGKVVLYGLIIMALLFTDQVTNIPRYIVMKYVGIINTYFAVLFPIFSGSLGVFLMERFMTQFPNEAIEASKIDGASNFMTFNKVVMPSLKPAWLTLAIFTFTSAWNNTSNDVLYSENIKMLPTVLMQIANGGFARVGVGSAVALVLLIPPFVFFALVQSQVIETMAHSGLK